MTIEELVERAEAAAYEMRSKNPSWSVSDMECMFWTVDVSLEDAMSLGLEEGKNPLIMNKIRKAITDGASTADEEITSRK